MLTVNDIVDRVRRDWLETPTDRPLICELGEDLTKTQTTFAYNDDLLSPEEQELLAPSTLIEVDTEHMLIKSVDGNNNQLTVIRGSEGTTKQTHKSGAIVTVSPTYSRNSIYNAVADAIKTLYPSLYSVRDHGPIQLDSWYPTAVPEDVEQIIDLYANQGNTWRKVALRYWDFYPGAATGKAVQSSPPMNAEGWLIYKAQFPRPKHPYQPLHELGVNESWVQLISVTAVSYLVGARDIDQTTKEYLSEKVNADYAQVGTASELRRALEVYRSQLLRLHMNEQKAKYKTKTNNRGVLH